MPKSAHTLDALKSLVQPAIYNLVAAIPLPGKKAQAIESIMIIYESDAGLSTALVVKLINHITADTHRTFALNAIKALSDIGQLSDQILDIALNKSGVHILHFVDLITRVTQTDTLDAGLLAQVLLYRDDTLKSFADSLRLLDQNGILNTKYFNQLVVLNGGLPEHHAALICSLHKAGLEDTPLFRDCWNHKYILELTRALTELEEYDEVSRVNSVNVQLLLSVKSKINHLAGRMLVWLGKYGMATAVNLNRFVRLDKESKFNLLFLLEEIVNDNLPAQALLLRNLLAHGAPLLTLDMYNTVWFRVDRLNLDLINQALQAMQQFHLTPRNLFRLLQPPLVPAAPINYSQSVHNQYVDRSVHRSIDNLSHRFANILSNKDCMKFISTLFQRDIIQARPNTCRAIDRIKYTHGEYRLHELSLMDVVTRSFLVALDGPYCRTAGAYVDDAIIPHMVTADLVHPDRYDTEDRAHYDQAVRLLIEAFQVIETGNGAGQPICAQGTWMQLASCMAGLHPLCNVSFITDGTISLKLQQTGLNLAIAHLGSDAGHDDYDTLTASVREFETIEPVLPHIAAQLADEIFDDFQAHFTDRTNPAFARLMENAEYIAFPPEKIPPRKRALDDSSASAPGFFERSTRARHDSTDESSSPSASP